jgi:GTPase SAR1 family protein
LWDTSVQERYRSLGPIYFQGASGAFLVYNICRRATFDSVPGWLSILMDNCTDPAFVVIGHRFNDSDREVAESEGRQFARQNSVSFFEVDSRVGGAFATAMHELLTKILHSHASTAGLRLP